MNTLIISANCSKQPFPVMPIGACIVAEAVKNAGYSVRLLDLMFCNDPLPAVISELNRVKPDVVGLSIRNIDNNDMKNPSAFFKDLPPLIDVIRKNTDSPVVIGGAAVGVMPEALLRYTGASFAILGDGETVFPQFLSALSHKEKPYHVRGVGWLKDNVFMRSPAVSLSAYSCPSPDFKRWVDINPYLSLLATVPVQTKRGCPYNCVYCTYAMSEGQSYRLFNPEDVVEYIKDLSSMGLHDIEFVDNVFNAPYDHAMAICEELRKSGLNSRFQTLELNPFFIDDALLTAMEQAGFVGIGITAESASDNVLRMLKKSFTSEHVYRAAQHIKNHILPCVWIFMLGGPGENRDTVRETLSFAENYIRPHDVAFFNIGIRIYPGTALEEIARSHGVLTLPSHEMLEPVFYLSPEIEAGWLISTLKAAMDKNYNFINSDSLALPFLSTIHRLGQRFGVKPPLWKHTSSIRRGLRFIGINA